MKQKIFLLAILLLSVFSFAQDIPVQVKKCKVFKERSYSSLVLAEDDGQEGVVIVRSYFNGINGGYHLEHYDSNLNLIKNHKYKMRGISSSQNSILGIFMNEQTVHLIEFIYDKGEKAYICSASSANISDFNFTKSELFRVKSEEIKKFSLFAASEYDGNSGTSMIFNEDKSAFAITIDINDKKSETHKVYLFDNLLNKHIEHTFKRNVKDKEFHYENIDVSKDGKTLYLLGKVYTGQSKKKKEERKYQYELTSITSKGEKTQMFNTGQNFVASLKTVFFDDKLACLGLYSEINDNRYKGICYFELEPASLELITTKFNPFTEQFMIDKYGENTEAELENLSLRNIIITENKELILNAEEYYSKIYTSLSQSGYNTYLLDYFNDIVSAKVSSSGEIIWARNINKSQFSSGSTSYVSYTSTTKDGKVYFFINADDKIKTLNNNRIQFGNSTLKKANLNVIRIDQNGDIDYRQLLTNKDNKVPFKVAEGIPVGDSVFFLGERRAKKQILKLTL